MNHSSSTKVTYFTDVEKRRFSIKTQTPTAKGFEVYNNYGPRPNEKLFLNYGFVLKDNPSDTLLLKVGYHGDQYAQAREHILKERKLGSEFYLYKGPSPIDANLLDYFRIRLMNDEELYFFEPQNHIWGSLISKRNEAMMYDILLNLMYQRFSKFPTSLEQDRELLKDVHMNERERLALIYRLGQKEILNSAIQALIHMQNEHYTKLAIICRPLLTDSQYRELDDKMDGNLIAYEKWLKANGSCKKIRCVDFGSTGKGFVSSLEIKQGEELLTIPRKLLITPNIVLNSKIGKRLKQIENIDEEMVITIFLMHENYNGGSAWAPFFKALSPISTPILFSDHELKELEGTFLLEETVELKAQYQQEWEHIYDSFSQIQGAIEDIYSWENYIWARTLVNSRAMPIEIDGVTQLTFIPLPVLPYHNANAKLIFRFNKESDSLSMYTLTSYGKNGRISHCYAHSNHKLFLDHGLVIEGNEEEGDTLPIELGIADELEAQKTSVLQSLGLSLDHLLKKRKLSPKLLASLRICVMTREELEQFVQRDPPSIDYISQRNEESMITTLINLLEIMLGGFHSTVEEDRLILTQSLTPNVRNAIVFRMDQKELLLSCLFQLKYASATQINNNNAN